MRNEKVKSSESNLKFVLLVGSLLAIYILIRTNIPSFEITENLGLIIFMLIILVITFRKKIS